MIEQQGVEHIRNTIMRYAIECDYIPEDALEVASSKRAIPVIRTEANALIKAGFKTQFIEKEELAQLLGAKHYFAAILYPNSFGINSYKYCQAMKDILRAQGVEIYEETPALAIKDHQIMTTHAMLEADTIILFPEIR